MQALCGFDVWARMDAGDMRLLEPLVQWLLREPRSRFRARVLAETPPDSEAGCDPVTEWVSWGRIESMLADTIDAINLNTVVTAAHGGKKKPRRPEPYRRPGSQVAPATPEAALEAMRNFMN